MRANENVILDNYFAVAVVPSVPPIEVRENRTAVSDRAVVPDLDVSRMKFVNVNQLRYPDVLSDLHSTQPVEPRPQRASSWEDEGKLVEYSDKKVQEEGRGWPLSRHSR